MYLAPSGSPYSDGRTSNNNGQCCGHRYRFCPHCGNFSHFAERLTYCIACGTKMIKECSSCRELIIYPTAKFCPACGAGLVSEAGRYYVTTFNATGLASGIYIYRLTTEQKADVRKMLLVK